MFEDNSESDRGPGFGCMSPERIFRKVMMQHKVDFTQNLYEHDLSHTEFEGHSVYFTIVCNL